VLVVVTSVVVRLTVMMLVEVDIPRKEEQKGVAW
jgi:hypothetical protein